MEIIIVENDLKIFYVTATSFPEGIAAAHEKIHSLAPFSPARKYFGISRPENGVIVYRAAAEEKAPGEAATAGCDTMTLEKGKYICLTIPDYIKDIQLIGESFKELLAYPNLDPGGYCVEWYVSDKEVKCMIRLDNKQRDSLI